MVKYASLQEIEKWENTIQEQDSANQLKSQKVKRIMSCYISKKKSESNVILTGLKFDEIKEEDPELMDRQIYAGKNKTIRNAKYQVLGFNQGDLNRIKEKIRDFFKENSKTENKIRISKPTLNNKKIIEEIETFVKSENSRIDFPPAKIRLIKCDLQTQANDKIKYADAKSEAYYGLRKLFDEKKIEFVNLPDLKNKIESQLGTISDDPQLDGRKKVIIAEDLSYEFVDALVFFIWNWGLVFDFIED